jgi:hypothetical protein
MRTLKNYLMGAALIVVALLPVHAQAAGNSVTRWVEQEASGRACAKRRHTERRASLRQSDGGDVRCGQRHRA